MWVGQKGGGGKGKEIAFSLKKEVKEVETIFPLFSLLFKNAIKCKEKKY